MEITGTLVLHDDVVIAPVKDLEDGVRAQIKCEQDDFAVSRPTSRVPSTVVDPRAADLLQRFRKPRTLVEAVILFSRERGLKPEEVLEGAYPLIRRFVDNQVLVSAGDKGERDSLKPRYSRGDPAAGCTVVRPLQILDDVELYQVRTADGRYAVLKKLRGREGGGGSRLQTAAMLEHEANLLRRLDGDIAPRLLDSGEIDGCAYLLLEWISGVDASAAGMELRASFPETKEDMAGLCVQIADAYARLHDRRVMHGDVHPRNLLVDRDRKVRLLDFGLGAALDSETRQGDNSRGGIPFFYEPEYARALIDGSAPPPVSLAGEQFAVAALLYYVVAGVHTCNFTLERQGMLRQLAEMEPLPFAERGLEPWPSLEAVLRRALSVDPRRRFASVAELAAALATCRDEETLPSPARPAPSTSKAAFEASLQDLIAKTSLDGPWLKDPFQPAPSASVNYGAAGVAHALHRISAARGDAALLALADVWASRALRWSADESGFFNQDIGITREAVGESSIYHSVSGVFAVQAMITWAMGDAMSQSFAIQGFLAMAARRGAGSDLTTGRASVLLGSALLLDTVPPDGPVDRAGLVRFGDENFATLWKELQHHPPIPDLDTANYGIAHGWAGYLYSSLQWMRASGETVTPAIPERLGQLAALAEPTGRGLRWPWQIQAGNSQIPYMPGWCNGSSGHVFLWTLAYRLFREERFLSLATGAAWDAWEAPDRSASLCCGLAGRSYALLNLFKLTDDPVWLKRARDLATLAARDGQWQPEYPHSLYKGYLALAVLSADLENPRESAQPMFEEIGTPAGAAPYATSSGGQCRNETVSRVRH